MNAITDKVGSAERNAFEEHFQSSWEDPTMSSERKTWSAAWTAREQTHPTDQEAEPSAVPGFPPRILALLQEVASRNPPPGRGVWEDGNGEPLQDDADAALAWIAAPPQAGEGAVPAEPAGCRISDPDGETPTKTALEIADDLMAEATMAANRANVSSDDYDISTTVRIAASTLRRLHALTTAAPAAQEEAKNGWMPIETAPEGERVLLGPRHAPVVGTVQQPKHWHEEQEPTATVVHYNGNVLVAGYRCSEWRRLPGAARARQEGGAA